MAGKMITVIEARPKTLAARLLALWRYRAFYSFLFQEISMKKFRDTALGVWWLILRPLIPTSITIVIFTFLAPMQSMGLPYAIFFLSGFISWNMFQSTIIFMPRTLLWMQGIMRRTYFPKLLVPFASVGPPLLELLVVLSLFVLSVVYFGIRGHFHMPWEPQLLLFPICIFLSLTFGFAVGTVLSVVAVFFRDVVFSVGYFAQVLMFLTPVIYPMTFVPANYRWIIYALNPMAQVVEVSRWSLTGVGEFQPYFFLLASVTIFIAFALSIAFFLRAETFLADEM